VYCIQHLSEVTAWEGRFPIAQAAYGSSYARIYDLAGPRLSETILDSIWPHECRRNSVLLQVSSWSLRHPVPLPHELRLLYESNSKSRDEHAKRFAIYTFDEGAQVLEALTCAFERKMRMTLHFPDSSSSIDILFGELLEVWSRQESIFRSTISSLTPQHGKLVGSGDA
jgi:hypothetical protein